MPPCTLSRDLAMWHAHAVARLLGVFAMIKGVLILTTASDRWTGPAFEAASAVPGGYLVWGCSILILGAVALFGSLTHRTKTVFWSLLGCGLWSMFFTIAYVISAMVIPNHPLDPTSTQLLVTICCFLTASVYRAKP
jgi:hypothetical protein